MVRIAGYDTQPLARTSKPPMSTYFNNLVNCKDPQLVHQADVEISKNPLLHSIMRNTIAPVFMNAAFAAT